MDFVLVWFILAGGSGYVAPLEVRAPPCGLPGTVVGVQLDRPTNPSTLFWPDPYFPDVHCRVDISGRVAALPPGTYHIATTEMGNGDNVRYTGIDPHTTPLWTRAGTFVPPAAAPVPISCTVQSTGAYSNGNLKLTLRCDTPERLPKGTGVTLAPKRP